MTDQIAYQEYIQRRYNAFCKTVIRCAALDKILKLKRQWERQVSLYKPALVHRRRLFWREL